MQRFTNAVRKKDVANYGSYAEIAGTNPNLNGGQWAYFRVSSYKLNPACPQGRCYSEIGWWKKSDGTFKGLLVWENPSYNQREFTYTQGQTHSFTNVYIPASGKWAFYYDGSWIWEDSMGYTSADLVFCGGEVATGVENMAYTLCGNGLGTAGGLQYMDLAQVWQYWNGHVVMVEDAPYETLFIDANNFRVRRNTE